MHRPPSDQVGGARVLDVELLELLGGGVVVDVVLELVDEAGAVVVVELDVVVDVVVDVVGDVVVDVVGDDVFGAVVGSDEVDSGTVVVSSTMVVVVVSAGGGGRTSVAGKKPMR
jgi:hypothetical protein